jgi:hypothetical protein
MRWNLIIGVKDIVFIVFSDVVFGCLVLALNVLPTLALIAKVTPPGIEGTIFALMTGSWNFADSVISPQIGAMINERFVGVKADDLSKYYLLTLTAFIFSFFGFLTLQLIPKKEEIEKI